MMTKEDYMRLPKERLAEMLVEKENVPTSIPAYPLSIPWYTMWCPLTNGFCTNPHHDCYNCPHHAVTAGYTTTCEQKIGEDKK